MQANRPILRPVTLIVLGVAALVSVGISLYFVYQTVLIPEVKLRGNVITKTQPLSAFVPAESIPVASSSSKLGFFLLSSYSYGMRDLLPLKPRVIKVMDPHLNQSLLDAVRQYRSSLPNGTVVLRISGKEPKFVLQDDPTKAAEQYYKQRMASALEMLKAYRNFFTHIESPNEVDNTPGWETIEEVQWHGKFWKRLTELYAEAGYRTCIGSIPVGNPGGDMKLIQDKLEFFAPALQAVVEHNGAICYHGYSVNYTTDVGVENWYSLRHRIITMALREVDPRYAEIPFIISEGGIDQTGDPATSGWQARGTELNYADWLEWFDSELQKDPNVIGVTLFQSGDSYWSSFDLEPLTWWFERHLSGTTPETSPAANEELNKE